MILIKPNQVIIPAYFLMMEFSITPQYPRAIVADIPVINKIAIKAIIPVLDNKNNNNEIKM